MTIRKASDVDFALFPRWLADDVEGSKYLLAYANTEKFKTLIDNQSRFLFIAEENRIPIGFFDFEIHGDKGHFAFFIVKNFRGKGFGKMFLQQALKLDVVQAVPILEAGVEEDNTTSRRVLESVGFSESGRDKDSMLLYSKTT